MPRGAAGPADRAGDADVVVALNVAACVRTRHWILERARRTVKRGNGFAGSLRAVVPRSATPPSPARELKRFVQIVLFDIRHNEHGPGAAPGTGSPSPVGWCIVLSTGGQ